MYNHQKFLLKLNYITIIVNLKILSDAIACVVTPSIKKQVHKNTFNRLVNSFAFVQRLRRYQIAYPEFHTIIKFSIKIFQELKP